jgi:hypothetical protein
VTSSWTTIWTSQTSSNSLMVCSLHFYNWSFQSSSYASAAEMAERHNAKQVLQLSRELVYKLQDLIDNKWTNSLVQWNIPPYVMVHVIHNSSSACLVACVNCSSLFYTWISLCQKWFCILVTVFSRMYWYPINDYFNHSFILLSQKKSCVEKCCRRKLRQTLVPSSNFKTIDAFSDSKIKECLK